MKPKVKNILAKHTKLQLATMVAMLTDGVSSEDIERVTGLPSETCVRIVRYGNDVSESLWA